MTRLVGIALTGIVLLASGPASADAVADFYRGKTIRVIVRTLTATDYDSYSRLLARFMGKYIPGNPTMIVVNMTGGGGIVAANYMAHVAPKDGTVIGIVSQGLAVDQALGMSAQLKANLRDFGWLGNMIYSNQLLVTWHTSPTKSLEDAKRRVTTIGTTGAGSASVQYPSFYNNIIGTRFKIIFGYRSGGEIDLAMEREEVEGRGTNPYASYMGSRPTWIPEKKLIPLVQAGLEKEPDLPDVPLITELNVPAQDKPLLEFMARSSTVGRPLAATPGVPPGRLAALRHAFDQVVKDPDFLAAAKKEKLDVRPQDNRRIAEIISGILDTPPAMGQRMKVALQPRAEHVQEERPGKK